MIETLIILTRFPEPGAVKTRLIPALGAQGAATLHREMTAYTIGCARRLAHARGARILVRFTGGNAKLMGGLFGDDVDYSEQGTGDLGDKVLEAIAVAREDGAQSVCVVGTDCPELDERVLDAAFDALAHTEAVVGPATDGGYYLIGLGAQTSDAVARRLFCDIAWGTPAVLEQTRKRLRESGVSYTELETLSDVDRVEDIPIWERRFGAIPPGGDGA